MITHPTTRQPWLHALLLLTLSVLVCYSFTTARAAEKEVPAKVREGETIKKPSLSDKTEKSDSSGKKPAMKDVEREGSKPSAERDGGTKKPGMRDGEGTKKPGSGDGEGSRKTGMKDGEKPRTSERDGEKPRTGSRDDEGMKKPGAERDGGAPARKGDGEGRKPSAESGQKPRKGDGDSATKPSSEVITMHVTASGDIVLINGEKQPISGLRGHLSTFLPDHPGAKVIVSGDPDTPLKSLDEIVDAVRDNGNKNVGIKAE